MSDEQQWPDLRVVATAAQTLINVDEQERELRCLVTELGEALATVIEELEKRGQWKFNPDGMFASLIMRARQEGK